MKQLLVFLLLVSACAQVETTEPTIAIEETQPAGDTIEGPALLRQCPDEWYDNRMPCTVGEECGGQYLIIDGERRELEEADLDWIRANCAVDGPTPVY